MPANVGGETDTVFVYGSPGIMGTITSPNGFSSPFTVGANDVTSVVIPSSNDLVTSGAVTNNGFVIATNNPSDNVGASYLSRQTATTDTTYLFNSSGLGTSYYAMGYQNTTGFPTPAKPSYTRATRMSPGRALRLPHRSRYSAATSAPTSRPAHLPAITR
jgi:hypothetical protein